jgi:CysZ protein
MNGNLITGAGYFFRGMAMLTNKRLRAFVILPLVANVSLFILFRSVAWSLVDGLVQTTEETLPSWLGFLTWLIAPVLWLMGSLATGYLSTLIVLVLTSPFHALLAEKVEEQVTGQAVPALEGIGSAIIAIPRGVFREIRKILYYIPLAVFVLVVTVIPGLQAFAPLLWFALGAWMMGLQFMDYPMDNHRMSFSDVKEACASRRLSSLGLGGMVAFVAGVPLVNLVVIPAAVVGATLMWCEELRHRQ